YAALSKFDSSGSELPSYLDLGSQFTSTLQPDDSETITDNPLTYTLTGTVTSPYIRQANSLTFRTGNVLTNFHVKITDNATGLTLRYIPDKAVWDAGEGGLTLVLGDNKFDFISKEADSPGLFNIGINPFIIKNGQQLDIEVRADSIDILGNSSGVPYTVADLQDGLEVYVATQTDLEASARVQSTGLLEGGVISSPTTSTVSWTAGRGQVVDFADPENPDVSDVTWSAVASMIPANLNTDGTSIFGYDKNGSIEQRLTTSVSIEDSHNIIWFGSATHISNTIISYGTAPGNIAYNGIGSFTDFINLVIGPANVDGNIYDANGANMNIDVVGGNAYLIGSNFRIDPSIANIITLANDTTVSFQKVYRSAGAGLNVVYDGSATTTIDPSQYDDGSGTLQTTTSGYWTIQRIFRSRSGLTFVAYGQEEFATKTAALSALGSESFTEKSPLPFMLYRCSLLVVQGAADLSDTAEAEFHTQPSFRLTGAQSSSVSIPGITSPGGSNTNIQINQGGVFYGDSKFTYDSTGNEVTIDGKLTVTGLIDPTGLVLTEQSSVPATPAAGYGYLWTKNTTPSTMIFTDDSGTDHLLEAGGGNVNGPTSATDLSICTYDGTSGELIQNNETTTLFTGSAEAVLKMNAPGSGGDSFFRLGNYAGSTLLQLNVDSATDTVNIQALSNTDSFNIGNLASDIDMNISVTGDASIDLRSTGANTNPPIIVAATGTDGATIQIFTSAVHPEGIITGNPGDLCIFKDGEDSRILQLESASAGNTGWETQGEGDVYGPASSTLYAIATYSDTTGKVLIDNPRAVIHDDLSKTELRLTSGDTSGQAQIKLRNSVNTTLLDIIADDISDTVSIEASSSAVTFSIENKAVDVDLELIVTGDAAVDVVSPGNNTNPPFRIASVGTNGAVIQFFTSTVDPESVITGNPGDICYFKSGTSSKIYQLESASAGNTGWKSQSQGNVSGPSPTVVNTIPVWSDTSGETLAAIDTAFITSDSTTTSIEIESPSVTGLAMMTFSDSASDLQLAVEYAETADRSQILDYSGNGLDFGNNAGLMSFRSTLANSMWLDLESPSSTSNDAGFRIKNSSDNEKLVIKYDEDENQSSITYDNSIRLLSTDSSYNFIKTISPGTSGFSMFQFLNSTETKDFSIAYGESADVSQISDNSGTGLNILTANRVRISTAASHTNPVLELKTTGTYGGDVGIHVGNQAPEGVVTGTPGSSYRRENGVDSIDYIFDGASAGTAGWKPHLKGPSAAVTANTMAYFSDTSSANIDSATWVRLYTGGNHTSFDVYPIAAPGTSQIGCWDFAESNGVFFNWIDATDTGEVDINDTGIHAKSGPDDSFINIVSKSATGWATLRIKNFADDKSISFDIDDTNDIQQMYLGNGIKAESRTDNSYIYIDSNSASGIASLNLRNSSDQNKMLLSYSESSGSASVQTSNGVPLQFILGESMWVGTLAGEKVTISSSGANTNAPLQLQSSGTDGANNHIFLSDVTPIGAIPGDAGDLCFLADAGIDSNLFIHAGASINSSDWHSVGFPKVKTSTATESIAINEDYIRIDATAATRVLTLPDASTVPIGKDYKFKLVAKGVGYYGEITPYSGDTIDGSTNTRRLATVGDVFTLRRVGTTSWDIVQSARKAHAEMFMSGSSFQQTGIGSTPVTITAWTDNGYDCQGIITSDQANNKFTIDHVEDTTNGDHFKITASISYEYSSSSVFVMSIFVGGTITNITAYSKGLGFSNDQQPIIVTGDFTTTSTGDVEVKIAALSPTDTAEWWAGHVDLVKY
ncbi:MAG: hypothetical protein GY744_03275, partial [Gammaproteobacteria bacterium]|nr:hypothetical protein [Gammaproteobacteria bacterium]